MLTRQKICRDDYADLTTRESLVAATLTIGAALVIAAIMIIGDSSLTKTIGLTMLPGVLVLPVQAMQMRRRSLWARLLMMAGPLVILFLIGLAAGLWAAS